MLKDAYSKKEVSELLGETRRTIQFWTDEGIVVPGVANPKGRGKTRLYSRRDLLDFLMIRMLTSECGLSLARIKILMHMLRRLALEEMYWDSKKNLPVEDRYVLKIYNAGTGKAFLAQHAGSGPVQLDTEDFSTVLLVY